VYINGRSVERCAEAAAGLAAAKDAEGRALVAAGDLSDAAQADALLARLEAEGEIGTTGKRRDRSWAYQAYLD
jgi:NAD(P)-dependent dehydrogenase (short-subunit alcohol dehydrogenase family)